MLSNFLIDEYEQQVSLGYTLWRKIPSSITQRVVASLDAGTSVDSKRTPQSLHRAAIDESLRLQDQGRHIKGFSPATIEWLRVSRQPWLLNISRSEWFFKGFTERKELAETLLNARNVSPEGHSEHIKTLVGYYKEIPDSLLEQAAQWRPVKKGQLLRALLDSFEGLKVQELVSWDREKRFRVESGGVSLELSIVLTNGRLVGEIYGFFDNPIANASYEGHFFIGIGEWDLIDDTNFTDAAAVFRQLLVKHLLWKQQGL